MHSQRTVSDLFGSGLARIRIPAESVEGIARVVEAERGFLMIVFCLEHD